jgi:four helix bundle protein
MSVPESFHARGFRFSLEILKFYRVVRKTNLPAHIANQLMRAGTSIGANLEEARSAYSRRDLASKHTIALREARETHYWLRLINADQPQLSKQVAILLEECSQLIAILTASVRKLRLEKVATSVTLVLLLASNFWLLTSGF